MQPLPSRAMQQLDRAIAEARDPVHNACLRAERVGLLARHGHLQQVRAELADLQACQQRLSSVALAAWICLAEGIAEYFGQLGSAARDRMMRAHALAGAARARPLLALCAAWLAQMDYVRQDLPAMARHLTEALQEAAHDHHAARARACLVVAEGYHVGGRLDLAQPWYERVREHATIQGDQLTVGALMRNRASLCASLARLAATFEPDVADGRWVRQALLAAESADSFDQRIGTASLGWMVPLLRAQLHVVQREYALALALYEAHLTSAMQAGVTRIQAVYYADVAWCRLQLGQRDAAVADARSAQAGLAAGCHLDDRALAHGLLAQVFGALQMRQDAEQHAAQGAADLLAYREQQAQLVAALDAALAKVP